VEAVGRFFSPPEISNPQLIIGVGTWGLISNIFGLFLFHEHGHDHGHSHGKATPTSSKPASIRSANDDQAPKVSTPPRNISPSHPRQRTSSYSSLYGHPAATRASLVQTAEEIRLARSPSPPPNGLRNKSRHHRSRSRSAIGGVDPDGTLNGSSSGDAQPATEATPLLSETASADSHSHSDDAHGNHDHGEGGRGHGHSHGSMNMHALLLHVLGDALGNVGVIATGLVILFTSWSWKYYFDPLISLVITIIIFSSAVPLVRSTSFILLQGVPSTVSIEDVKDAILAVEGVLSLHELHVWQLSESKIVASVHVMASRNHDFMPVAAAIRKALHHQGIHSSTIQPEYHPRTAPPEENLKTSAETSCLIMCPPDQECNPAENACCPPPAMDV